MDQMGLVPMGGHMPPPGGHMMMGGTRAPGFKNDSHGVVTMLTFEKCSDLPYPRNPRMNKVLVTVLVDDPKTGLTHELRRIGPFPLEAHGRNLLQADLLGTRVQVSAPLHFGGEAKEGAMYLKVGLAYTEGLSKNKDVNDDPVGHTQVFVVGFRQQPSRYYEIRPQHGMQVLGGMSFTHRLISEAQAQEQGLVETESPHTAFKQQIAPIEVNCVVRGRKSIFPVGSPEEALERAAVNCEAQNRATLQRLKKTDPNPDHEANPHVTVVNGYREWDSLDSLFATMGPNPMAMSDEVGPTVCRGYLESTSIIKQVAPKLPPVNSPADEAFNLSLLSSMYKKNPFDVRTAARPVICKDPVEIAAHGMNWCPDPAFYIPLRNMNLQDRETVNLACYEPHQCAKLNFADASPSYQIGEDIWGVQAEYKAKESHFVPRPAYLRRYRVKDDCAMA